MKFTVVALTACLFSVLTAPAIGQSYTITDLGAVGDGINAGGANAINSKGQVAGRNLINFFPHAYLWSAKGTHDLDENGVGSSASGIDSAGNVVGESVVVVSGSPQQHAVLWKKSNPMIDLGTLPGGSTSFATGIRASGQIVGYSDYTGSAGVPHAFLWTSNTGMRDLGTLPGGSDFAQAHAINTDSHVAGTSANHACLWTRAGTIQDLGALSGGLGVALGLNDSDHVVGYSLVIGLGPHAFFWTKDDGMLDLGSLPGGTVSIAESINNTDQIVGYSYYNPSVTHAILWNAQGMQDLNNLIPANSGWVLIYAASINDRGQIVGAGTFNGALHAYLLNPI